MGESERRWAETGSENLRERDEKDGRTAADSCGIERGKDENGLAVFEEGSS